MVAAAVACANGLGGPVNRRRAKENELQVGEGSVPSNQNLMQTLALLINERQEFADMAADFSIFATDLRNSPSSFQIDLPEASSVEIASPDAAVSSALDEGEREGRNLAAVFPFVGGERGEINRAAFVAIHTSLIIHSFGHSPFVTCHQKPTGRDRTQ